MPSATLPTFRGHGTGKRVCLCQQTEVGAGIGGFVRAAGSCLPLLLQLQAGDSKPRGHRRFKYASSGTQPLYKFLYVSVWVRILNSDCKSSIHDLSAYTEQWPHELRRTHGHSAAAAIALEARSITHVRYAVMKFNRLSISCWLIHVSLNGNPAFSPTRSGKNVPHGSEG